ncbi:sigma-70 family RNA polymerase sigma factor [Rummeliibacillus sp. NPDC094406]|uniref:sigma-70 family RNA polymerase sigma factor n=1 Tax=Rummeliibacillus sp. NPDC094406 TaxID=3364511 RepID=UPI0038110CB0
MFQFDEILEQYEPMISAAIRKCRIYKNHEHYAQTARIALWKAWKKYDHVQGDFAPYAFTCIRGSILDELKKENRYEERYQPEQDDIIELYLPTSIESDVSNILEGLLNNITKAEQQFLIDYYIGGYSYEELSVKYHASAATLQKRRTRILEKVRKAI